MSLWPNTICGQSKAMSSPGAMDELARCDHEQREIESREHRAGWLAVGWADWEIERELIVRDAAANSRPLYPDDPKLAGNQRIEILLLRERPVLPPMR